SVPMTQIAQELGSAVMRNTVSLGVSAYILGLPIDEFKKALEQRFARRPELAEQNIKVLDAGYEYAKENLADPERLLAAGSVKSRQLTMVNEAVALGAAAACCRFSSAYPITPASEVMENLMSILPRFGGKVVQAEDESAAITACIGAGFAGARA